MTVPARRRRPPIVVLGWAGVLAATVSLGLLGQRDDGDAAPRRTQAAGVVATPAPAPTTSPISRPAPVRPAATRPPIGEDGVMGGIVFGTAWGWLDPEPADR